MSWFAWCLSVLIVALALLYVSPKLRKTAFIWFTYISLTGWYYFRLWEKKRNGGHGSSSPTAKATKKPASKLHTDSNNSSIRTQGSSSRSASSFTSSSRSVRQEEADIEDIVYFESVEKLQQQQRELRHGSERSARLSGSSSSGNSGYSDDSLAKLSSGHHHQQQAHPKSHLGIFRSLHKSHREDDKHRDSDMTSGDPLARSTVSEPGGGTRTRRTYTGRKKPPSWAD